MKELLNNITEGIFKEVIEGNFEDISEIIAGGFFKGVTEEVIPE